LGGEGVLYVATVVVAHDADLERRVRLHRERRPAGWGTLEIGDLDLVLDAARSWDPLILVSDEVGLGVVPESGAGRRFRDALGLVNQRAAAAAAEVHLCVAGVGLRIK
jgi:adenosylcobinamide kinase/adenosylcobinamide-phosphate guanylyltransferase